MTAKTISGRPLKVGMAGLTSLYWPIALAQSLAKAKGARLVAAGHAAIPREGRAGAPGHDADGLR